jgi:hypothetical protein
MYWSCSVVEIRDNVEFRCCRQSCDRAKLKEFIKEAKLGSIIYYAGAPSAPYSMVDDKCVIKVQNNNVLGILSILFVIQDVVPKSRFLKMRVVRGKLWVAK